MACPLTKYLDCIFISVHHPYQIQESSALIRLGWRCWYEPKSVKAGEGGNLKFSLLPDTHPTPSFTNQQQQIQIYPNTMCMVRMQTEEETPLQTPYIQ